MRRLRCRVEVGGASPEQRASLLGADLRCWGRGFSLSMLLMVGGAYALTLLSSPSKSKSGHADNSYKGRSTKSTVFN